MDTNLVSNVFVLIGIKSVEIDGEIVEEQSNINSISKGYRKRDYLLMVRTNRNILEGLVELFPQVRINQR